ncbi:inhibitor of nuclear factor kappa-B kinase subunit alpha isoform X2 [Planococcus citri]|uniref:inhibitor of nuclear factor kappa-B kinase subunit alpha isoform X2 n=1 Tax=Planococcus citri TaxID=170843 RepID=UPI0031F891F6
MDIWIKERVLGTGSFGVVTLWKNSKTQAKLALKQCKLGLENSLSENQKKRWCNEIEIMFKLNYPNIVQATILPQTLKEVINSSLPVLCMEYCSRGDLRQILNQPQNCCGLQEKEIRHFLLDIKNALQYLHDLKITHRDLKPENILLQESSYNSIIIYKLTDLGYAKELDHNGLCSSFVGTLQYLAPELFLGEIYSSSVDYWSFGLVLFEVITGIRPFLPHTPPILWMKYVKNKCHDHICIYQSTTGHIRYSTTMFMENHVSECFQREIEKWLQLALEWDPKKRGIELQKITIFSKLDDISEKKILSIFCADKCNFLSYEVDNSTAIPTVLGWITRDTKISSDSLILLSSDGKEIDRKKFAVDYYNPDEEIMIYVYRADELKLPQMKPKPPRLVIRMMENPLEILSYFYLKRTLAQTIYFLQKETLLFRSFLNAYKIKMLFVINLSLNSSSICDDLLLELNKILSNQKMCRKLLHFDVKCYNYLREQISTVSDTDRTIKQWQLAFETLVGKVDLLLTEFHNLKTKCNKKLEEISVHKNEYKTEATGFLRFEQFVKLGCQSFEKLPADRDYFSTPIEAVKIVKDFMKQRTLSFKNEKFDHHLQRLCALENEIKEINAEMTLFKSRVSSAKSDILDFQFIRHKNMWELMANALSQMLYQSTLVELQKEQMDHLYILE